MKQKKLKRVRLFLSLRIILKIVFLKHTYVSARLFGVSLIRFKSWLVNLIVSHLFYMQSLSRLVNVEFPLPHYFRLFEYGQVGLLSLNCLTFHVI